MKLEEHSSTNLFSSGGTSFVVLLNLFVTCYNVIEHDFGAFLSMELVEDWIQVLLFELLQESVTSLSRKLIILSLPRDILSVSKRLGNKKKRKKKTFYIHSEYQCSSFRAVVSSQTVTGHLLAVSVINLCFKCHKLGHLARECTASWDSPRSAYRGTTFTPGYSYSPYSHGAHTQPGAKQQCC